MYEIKVIKDTIVGFHFDYKDGDTIYWKPSIYSENFMEWTAAIYTKTDDGFKNIGSVRQSAITQARDFNTTTNPP